MDLAFARCLVWPDSRVAGYEVRRAHQGLHRSELASRARVGEEVRDFSFRNSLIACRPKPACGPKPFRVSPDALMLFDNPFFTCELRQHRRRRSRVVFLLLSGLGLWSVWLVGLLLIGLTVHVVARTPFQLGFINFGSLVLLHAAGCLAAGSYGGDLVVGRDVRQKTLPALRLLPMRPEQLVAGKIAFPIYIVGVVWSAGVPLYVLAVLLNLASVSEALRGLLITGWGGLAILALTLLGTSRQTPPPLEAIAKWKRGAESTCRGLLVIGAGILTLMLAIYGWSIPDQWAFFGVRISAWLPGCLLTGLLASMIARHGRALLADELATSPIPALAGLAVCYLLLLGAFWHGLPFWGRCLAVVGPVLLAIPHLWHLRQLTKPGPESTVAVSKSRHKEDAWTQGELEWIASRWGNPLLLRDLRVIFRSQSLRRRMLYTASSQVLLLVVFYFLVRRFGSSVISGAASGFFSPLMVSTTAVAARWDKERTSGTLPLLLLTPLSSREMLIGRLMTSFVVILPLLVLPALALIGGIGWLATTRFWPAGPMILSALPLLLTVWVSAGCSNATSGQHIPGFQSGALFSLARTGIVLLVPGGCAALMAVSQGGPLLCCGLALLIGGLHLGFAVFVFREYERKLDAYRRGDVDPAAI